MIAAWVYMLRCSDGSYYVGSARGETLDKRMAEHQSGALGGYTSTRRPVELVWSEWFQSITDAIAVERQIKGWNRAKKQALIARDYEQLPELAKRRTRFAEKRAD
jgi:putative endonuclease